MLDEDPLAIEDLGAEAAAVAGLPAPPGDAEDEPAQGAAPAKRPHMVYLVAALAGGNLLGNALRMAGGLLQMRFVTPLVLGTFNGIGLNLQLARFLQVGIFNGLSRELPYYYGQGDVERVRGLAAAAQAWSILLGAGTGLVFTAMAGWHAAHGDWIMGAGWLANAVAGFVFFQGTMYLPATYRTASDFARLSAISVAQNAAAFALVGVVWSCGYYGICVRAAVTSLVGAWLLQKWVPIRVWPKWNWGHFRHLLIIGLPIAAVGELGGPLFDWIDQKLVQHHLDAEGLGLYSMVVLLKTTMELLPIAASQVLYPRMTEQYGRGGDLGRLFRMTVKPTAALVGGMVPLVALGWFLAGPMTRVLLPKYVAAVPAMQWCLLLPLALSCCLVFNVYNIVRRQGLYVVALVLNLGSYLAALWWLTRDGVYLAAFPQAMLAGRVVYVVAGFALLLPVSLRHRRAKDS